MLTDARTEFLDTLAARLDEQAKHHYEYETTHEDSSLADYVHGVGYGDGELSLDHLEPETALVVERAKRLLAIAARLKATPMTYRRRVSALTDMLAECSDLKAVHGYSRVRDAIYGATHGELEVQPDDESAAELEKLTPEEREYLEHQLRECCLSGGLLYVGAEYDRWELVLDADKLTEACDDLEVSLAEGGAP